MTAEPRCWGGGGVSHPSQLTTGLVIKSVTTSPTLAGERMLFILQVSILSEQDDGSHPSNPSLFDKSIFTLSGALAAQTSVTANMSEYATTKRRESDLSHVLFTLPDNLKRELLVVPGAGSLLLINLCCQRRLTILRKIPCYLPRLPLPLCLKLRLKLSCRVVPIGTTHLCMLHVRASQASASVPLPLLFGARSEVVAGFCLHTIRDEALAQVVDSLLRKGAIELAPHPSLSYYNRLFIVMKTSGSWRPVIDLSLLNLIVLKIHHPEGCISASSDASGIQIVSSVHGSLLWSLRCSSGLHAVMATD